MQVNPAIFRAYDIRGVVATDLRPDVVELIGKAFASAAIAAGQERVVIGFDGRHSSPELADSLARGLMSCGIAVYNIGLVPTPLLYFATYQLQTGTGIMITGSHNPPEYNGLKMMLAGKTLHSADISALYQRIIDANFIAANKAGSVQSCEVLSAYIAKVKADIKIGKQLKFAYDCGNGAAGAAAQQVFAALGLDALGLYTEIDGDFPNHHPDPSKPENLRDLIDLVRARELDLGLAFDGDGDRLGVVDAKGNIIWADRQMMLYATDVLARNAGAPIVFDVKCSQNLASTITRAGGQALMGKTGHSFVKAQMLESGAPLGGEMSGHIFFKERWYGFDDGIYTALRLLEILSNSAPTPTEVFASLPNSVNTPEINISFAEGEHYKFIDKFCQNADFGNAEIITIDGLRANFGNGWGLVRASNTTPSLVLRFEADDAATLAAIQSKFREQMLQIDPNLQLDF